MLFGVKIEGFRDCCLCDCFSWMPLLLLGCLIDEIAELLAFGIRMGLTTFVFIRNEMFSF